MKFDPTPAQQNAIDAKGCILVSAAAGSGKTAVLVERVIKMLTNRENPVLANRLLIVTFTNAAAAEMLSRIEARLYEELEKDPENELLCRQRYLIKTADICTIDSFCIRLVRDNFALCGIEPDFKVTEDSALLPLRQEVLRELLGEYLENPTEELKALLQTVNCSKDETNLVSLLDAIYVLSKNEPFSEEYYKALESPYVIPFDNAHPWYRFAFSAALAHIAAAKRLIVCLTERALYEDKHDKATVFCENTSRIVEYVESEILKNDWDIAFELSRTAKTGSVPNGSSDDFKNIKAKIADHIRALKDIFTMPSWDIKAEISRFSPAVKLLFGILREFDKRISERLKEENVFAFNEIEQIALGMFAFVDENGNAQKTDRADELTSRYDQVLVDEFQDVNNLQNMLFELLSGGGKNLFIVGDVKQSIYAFRGTNPDIFLNKKNLFGFYDPDEKEGAGGRKILLSDNYRSRKGICETVNYFFRKLMIPEVGPLVYDSAEQLNPAAEYPDNGIIETDFLVVDKVDDQSEDSAIQSESLAIAEYIKETMAQGAILKDKNGGLRNAEYGDFCILLAALKNKADTVVEQLVSSGIPARTVSSSFKTATETVIALALLKIISDPYSDLELLNVLMSPLYGFSAEEMALIRTGKRSMPLYSAVCACAEKSPKVKAFLDDLSDMRRMSCMLTLDRLVSYVLDKTDMINVFYSLPCGDARAENLMLLMKKAAEYSGNSNGGIYGFLQYISALTEDPPKTSESADDNCVKVISIHKSKGLQFPICIVAGLGVDINKKDASRACIYSEEYGIGFKYYDHESFEEYENYGHKVLVASSKKRIAEERLRLLYVAMTRAQEKLCLISCLKNAQATLLKAAAATDNGENPIGSGFIAAAQSSAQYILAAALMHPDAEALRSAAECSVKVSATDSRMNVRFIDASKLQRGEGIAAPEPLPDPELTGEILKNAGYVYPYNAIMNVPAKISVSAMANKAEAERFAMTDRPAFMEKDGLSAAGRGTATHKIMQFIDFSAKPDIESEIKRLVNENRLTENEAAAVDREKLKAFFQSDLFARMCASSDLRREMRFLTSLPVSYYGIDNVQGEEFIVQGAVDLCFTEPDGVVVVDFKTDRVNALEELAETYGEQLKIYSVACEKIFGMPVKERIIYSFHLSDKITL